MGFRGSRVQIPPSRLLTKWRCYFPPASSAEGLTLAELQAIGSQVGLTAERIAEAATSLELRRSALPRRTSLGMPISVGRTVELPRAPTDREWGLLLAELRQTFGARGREDSRGELRQWTNGNLHAFVEPTETSYRLRLGSMKGDAQFATFLGIGAAHGLLTVARFFPGGDFDELVNAMIFAVMGAAALGFNALRLPRWALEREQQMDYLAARGRALIAPVPDAGGAG